MVSLLIAANGLRHRWRRYFFLGLGLCVGFALVLLLTGLAEGMKRNVAEAAERHYGGDVFVLGHQQSPFYTPVIRDDGAILAALKRARIDPALVVRRTNFFENGQIFFNGYAARQKTVTGIDWDSEGRAFSGLQFASGGLDGMGSTGGILLSSVTAGQLGARVGDDVVLEVDTVTGQRNTAPMVVSGIFKDDSIFGAYTSYVDRRLLSRLIGLDSEEYTTLGTYLRDPETASRDSQRLYAALAGSLPMFKTVRTQQELWVRLGERWTGVKYAVLTLDGYLSDIHDVISAVDVGLVLILVMMLAVVTLGIGNTYRVMVHERVREIGTLRAVGMQKAAVFRLILAEAFLLGVVCVACGSLAGFLLLEAAGRIQITGIPGFDIFLRKGCIGWRLSPREYVLAAALVIAAVLLGGFIPARKAASVVPARALRRDA